MSKLFIVPVSERPKTYGPLGYVRVRGLTVVPFHSAQEAWEYAVRLPRKHRTRHYYQALTKLENAIGI